MLEVLLFVPSTPNCGVTRNWARALDVPTKSLPLESMRARSVLLVTNIVELPAFRADKFNKEFVLSNEIVAWRVPLLDMSIPVYCAPALSNVSCPPLVAPTTCRAPAGLVVPIPTLPVEVMRIASTPPSANASVSAAGLNSPVFGSPSKLKLGAAAVPAGALASSSP